MIYLFFQLAAYHFHQIIGRYLILFLYQFQMNGDVLVTVYDSVENLLFVHLILIVLMIMLSKIGHQKSSHHLYMIITNDLILQYVLLMFDVHDYHVR